MPTDPTADRPAVRNGMRPEHTDPLPKRFFYKLASNIFSFSVNVAVQAIVPRALGPKSYGDFSLLSTFFTRLFGFFDMGTSICFYTKLSQKPRDYTLLLFYSYFIAAVVLSIFGITLLLQSSDMRLLLLPGQEIAYIYLALAWGCLYFLAGIIDKVGDACGLTVAVEKLRIVQRAIGMVIILILFYAGMLNLRGFFNYYYIIFIFFIVSVLLLLKRRGFLGGRPLLLESAQVREYGREFYTYSHPLFVFSLIGLIADYFDRWLLQVFAGSVQQGFFGLSYQIGAICLIVTSSIIPLFTRELAIAFKEQNREKIAALFKRYIPMFSAVATYFSCFLVIQHEKITFLVGGDKYKAAAVAVGIMAFFPIFQAYGQLTGSAFYAMGYTKLYRNIGIWSMVIGLPITYLMIAPADKFGFDGGAIGLSLKFVLSCFVGVNIQLYYITKILLLDFFYFFRNQLQCIFIFACIAFASAVLGDYFLNGAVTGLLLSFVSAGLLYTTAIIILVSWKPSIVGIQPVDVQKAYGLLMRRKH